VCLVTGLVPFVIAHPYIRALLPSLCRVFLDVMPFILVRLGTFKDHTFSKLGFQQKGEKYPDIMRDDDGADNKNIPLPLSMVVRRVIDDDRLSDECWNSEMREVQLWENERFGGMFLHSPFIFYFIFWLADDIVLVISSGPIPPDSSTLIATTMGASSSSSSSSASSSSAFAHPHKGWSKQNLKAGERGAWTRGRDGWSGVGMGGYGSMVEGSGEVRFVFFCRFCRFSFFIIIWVFLCIWLDGCSFIFPLCGNDRHTDTFPALFLL